MDHSDASKDLAACLMQAASLGIALVFKFDDGIPAEELDIGTLIARDRICAVDAHSSSTGEMVGEVQRAGPGGRYFGKVFAGHHDGHREFYDELNVTSALSTLLGLLDPVGG